MTGWVGLTAAAISRVLSGLTSTLTFGAGITSNATIRAIGTFSSDDGRFQQTSGPIIDMRTTNTVKFFRSDNSTFAEIQIGNTVNTVSPTSPNRTVTMVIGGTTYYLHAKTTND